MLLDIVNMLKEVIKMLDGLHGKVDRLESKVDAFHHELCGEQRDERPSSNCDVPIRPY